MLELALALLGSLSQVAPVLLADTDSLPVQDPEAEGSDPIRMVPFGEDFLLVTKEAERRLWHLDGDSLTPTALIEPNEVDEICIADLGNGHALFTISPSTTWSTDGTPAGTFPLVLDGAPLSTVFVSYKPVIAWAGRGWFVLRRSASTVTTLELWSSDGTNEGSVLEHVFDFVPVPLASSAVELFTAGEKLFLSVPAAFDQRLFVLPMPGSPPVELGPISSPVPGQRTGVALNGELAYRAATESEGSELWFTDGTIAGTRRVLDIYPGIQGSNPSFYAANEEAVWFRADSPTAGPELWLSDGTPEGTRLVVDSQPGPRGSIGEVRGALTGDGRLIYSGDNLYNVGDPYVSNGTASGSGLIKDLPDSSWVDGPNNFFAFEDRVAFSAYAGPVPGTELFVTDGRPDGIRMLTNFFVGGPPTVNYGSDPVPLLENGGKLYFSAFDLHKERELWSTQGEVGDFELALELALEEVTDGGATLELIRLGDRVLFTAETDGLGLELWSTDGTPGGTQLVKDIAPGPFPGKPNLSIVLGPRVLMSATGPDLVRRPYASDGTPEGTVALTSPETSDGVMASFSGVEAPTPEFIRLGSIALFVVRDFSGVFTDWKLHRTDGTPGGTWVLETPPSSVNPETLADSAVLGNKLIYGAFDEVTLFEPWITDGTGAGTSLLADLMPGTASSAPTDFTRMGNYVYFAAETPMVGRELYRTDGTEKGTSIFFEGSPYPLKPENLAALDDVLLFSGRDSEGHRELWVSDGTQEGTTLLLDLGRGILSSPDEEGCRPFGFKRVGDRLAFVCEGDAQNENQGFWLTDGTPEGTEQVTLPGIPSFRATRGGEFTYFGGSEALLFPGYSTSTGAELWTWSGSGSLPSYLREVNAGPGSSSNGGWEELDLRTVELGGRLIFIAEEPELGLEPYALDLLALGVFGAEPFGTACSTGFAPEIGFSGSAHLGETLNLLLSGVPPGATAFAYYGTDFIPSSLSFGCTQYFSNPQILGMATADASGTAKRAVTVPDQAALVGLPIALQWIFEESGGPLGGQFGASNALEVVPNS